MNQFDSLRRVAGEDVSRETYEQMLEFERFFRHWTKSINLASPSSLDEFWSRHILDSAQLWRYRGDASQWTDLGSGGGLPGIVVAILARVSEMGFNLVESNNKKASFLRSCAAQFDLPLVVHAKRIEDVSDIPTEVISARALASLTNLLGYSEAWFRAGPARALLQKGRDYQSEIDEARRHWSFDLIDHQSVLDPMSRILEITNVQRLER